MSVVQLDPSSLRRPATVNLQTTGQDKFNRLADLKKQIDKQYEERSAQTRAAELGLPYINLYGFPVSLNVLLKFPKNKHKQPRLPFLALRIQRFCWLLLTPIILNKQKLFKSFPRKAKKLFCIIAVIPVFKCY